MKLYVCYNTMATSRPGGHPCSTAHKALVAAGHEPEVVKSYGLGLLPDKPFNQTRGRKRVKELTGHSMVPALELDDGTSVAGSEGIIAWANAHSAVGA